MNIVAPDLPISFGICVGPNFNSDWLDACVESIKAQNVPEYEIILIFNKGEIPHNDPDWSHVKYIECDGWLPQKKNLFALYAKHENLCIVHDYYRFDDDWYDGVKEYNASINGHWDVLSTFVLREEDGERGPDWVINPFYMKKFLDDPENFDVFDELQRMYPTENHPMYVVGLNPHEKRLTSLQYVSGGYIMCKRELLRTVKFDETLKVGQPEDIEWFERVKKSGEGYRLRFNPFSIVYTMKPNKWKVFPLPAHHVERLNLAMTQGYFAQ
jgi:hypothetical protein